MGNIKEIGNRNFYLYKQRILARPCTKCATLNTVFVASVDSVSKSCFHVEGSSGI